MRAKSSPRRSRKQVKQSSLLKRSRRRTHDEVQNELEWVQHILSGEEGQITIRHLFYRLVGEGIIPKNEAAYKGLCAHLAKWRRSGAVEWDAFADSTRWHIKPDTFDSLDEALSNTVATYRRNLWSAQPYYVELWVEKDAMASILSKAAAPFGVPVFVARGFASLSSLYSAANTFRGWTEAGKQCVIYHFGDHDPSGVEAGESMVRAFRDDFKVDIQFRRAAVTEEQIERLHLPTRPTKASNHNKGWEGDSVELDTMPPAEIRALAEACITQHIDKERWEATKLIEKAERQTLEYFREGFQKGPQ